MGKNKKNKLSYWTARKSKLWHMKDDCPILLLGYPEKIGSMEISMRGLRPCQCAGGEEQGEGVIMGLTNDK